MQLKQTLVKLIGKNEGDAFIKFLENNGFSNIQNLSYDRLKIKVLVVDKKEFFGTNVTCLSALAMFGIKPIDTKQFITKFENKNSKEKA